MNRKGCEQEGVCTGRGVYRKGCVLEGGVLVFNFVEFFMVQLR